MIFRHLLNMRSHPTWVRGLKLIVCHGRRHTIEVAPYVGAWIETPLSMLHVRHSCVAPYVGAWIETSKELQNKGRHSVAPYVGAWIETSLTQNLDAGMRSHPTWVRGLKLSYLPYRYRFNSSHPTWVRGLKHK